MTLYSTQTNGKELLLFISFFNIADWPVEYIILTATIPSALTGVDIVIFASSFAYLSDITSIENRTLRVTILDACYLTSFPIGIALGTFLCLFSLYISYVSHLLAHQLKYFYFAHRFIHIQSC